MDAEDFEDEDDYDPVTWRLVESKPLTIWVLVHFILSIIVGFFRTVTEATSDLGDAVIGHEGYLKHKKEFADNVRAELETLPTENN